MGFSSQGLQAEAELLRASFDQLSIASNILGFAEIYQSGKENHRFLGFRAACYGVLCWFSLV
jgi:hypothetical protein